MTGSENSPLFLAQPSRFGQTLVQQTPFSRQGRLVEDLPIVGLFERAGAHRPGECSSVSGVCSIPLFEAAR